MISELKSTHKHVSDFEEFWGYDCLELRMKDKYFCPLNDLRCICDCTKKKNRQTHFIYLDNKEIYYTYKTCCIISVSLSTNHALKFKHQVNCLEANKI